MADKLLIDKKGKRYLLKKGDLHTSLGVIKQKDIKNGKVKTHLGKELICFPASFIDKIEKIERGPAIFTKKDIGIILANVPIDKNTKIVDAGVGCGILASFLAKISNNVTSYEIEKKHCDIAKKNFKFLNVNVKIKNKDVFKGIDEKNLDLITLDLKHPEKVLPHAQKSLKQGGYLVVFLPNTSQVQTLIKSSKGFYHIKTIEIIEREWLIDEFRLRPKNMGLVHTGFLSFFRKL